MAGVGRVIVVGSVNVDLVVRVPELPRPGVTVSGGELSRHHGGKGGNQAAAAARLGAQVFFVGAVGRDEMGDSALAALVSEGVEVSLVRRVDGPTGVALIVVDDAGQNQIAVAPGSNLAVDGAFVAAAMARLAPAAGDVVLVSREIPADGVREGLEAGRAGGATTILNPAPADGLDAASRAAADILTPNESELEAIAGTGSLADAAGLLAAVATRALVVTLGAAGAGSSSASEPRSMSAAPKVTPVDTTGAGDTFNGGLAALLADGRPLAEAVRLAVRAASLSTLRAGAREGMPTADELGGFGGP